MRVYYDTEFIDTGTTIELISIGMVREDGKYFYRVVKDLELMDKASKNPWLRSNVLSSLPVTWDKITGSTIWDDWHWDWKLVKSRDEIRAELRKFLADTPNLELWAWYAAYDHVALAQIFGTMLQLPQDVPMWTNDLRQELHRLGNPRYPEQAEGAHNALADARWNKILGDYLQKLDGPIERR